MRFHIQLMLIFKALKSHFKGSYDKQNLTLSLVVIYNMKFMKLAEGLFNKFHIKWALV